jgi:hypothetical protein
VQYAVHVHVDMVHLHLDEARTQGPVRGDALAHGHCSKAGHVLLEHTCFNGTYASGFCFLNHMLNPGIPMLQGDRSRQKRACCMSLHGARSWQASLSVAMCQATGPSVAAGMTAALLRLHVLQHGSGWHKIHLKCSVTHLLYLPLTV